MKHILVGTDRTNSRSKSLALYLQNIFSQYGESVEIIDLAEFEFGQLAAQYGKQPAGKIGEAISRIESSEGVYIVVPEYNGSMPGALKHFIDYWKYPDCFEGRPLAFMGLGGMFGGLRPVEHLQQVFGYRNAYIFPQRIFVQNVWNVFKDGELKDPVTAQLVRAQVEGFLKFIKALQSVGLDANSLIRTRSN